MRRHNLNWLHDYLGSAGGSGEGGAGGQCPAAGPKSEEECAGSVPNCWSPGKDSVTVYPTAGAQVRTV
jgi:hypothetical protein